MKVKTLVAWNEPNKGDVPGKYHAPGDIAEIDPKVVFDLDDLLRLGTVEKVIEAPPVGKGEA